MGTSTGFFARHSLGIFTFVVACIAFSCTSNSGTGAAGNTGGSTICAGQNPPKGTGTLLLCGQCLQTYCCTEAQVCSADADCPALETCLQRCEASDSACINACDNLYPNSIATYNNLTNCGSQECNYACDTPPGGCTNVPLGTNAGCEQTQFPLPWDCASGPPEQTCVASPDGTANRYCCLY